MDLLKNNTKKLEKRKIQDRQRRITTRKKEVANKVMYGDNAIELFFVKMERCWKRIIKNKFKHKWKSHRKTNFPLTLEWATQWQQQKVIKINQCGFDKV